MERKAIIFFLFLMIAYKDCFSGEQKTSNSFFLSIREVEEAWKKNLKGHPDNCKYENAKELFKSRDFEVCKQGKLKLEALQKKNNPHPGLSYTLGKKALKENNINLAKKLLLNCQFPFAKSVLIEALLSSPLCIEKKEGRLLAQRNSFFFISSKEDSRAHAFVNQELLKKLKKSCSGCFSEWLHHYYPLVGFFRYKGQQKEAQELFQLFLDYGHLPAIFDKAVNSFNSLEESTKRSGFQALINFMKYREWRDLAFRTIKNCEKTYLPAQAFGVLAKNPNGCLDKIIQFFLKKDFDLDSQGDVKLILSNYNLFIKLIEDTEKNEINMIYNKVLSMANQFKMTPGMEKVIDNKSAFSDSFKKDVMRNVEKAMNDLNTNLKEASLLVFKDKNIQKCLLDISTCLFNLYKNNFFTQAPWHDEFDNILKDKNIESIEMDITSKEMDITSKKKKKQ